MKSHGVLLGISGTLFGLLVGWILGSQQARPAAPASVQAQGTARSSPAAPPLDLARAAELERQANARPRDAAVRVALADLYLEAQRFDLAIPWYQAAVKMDRKNIQASTDLALSLLYTGDAQAALKQIDHSLSIDARHVKSLLSQGFIRAFGTRDLAGAAESWQKVMTIAPGSPEANEARRQLDGLKAAHPNLGGGQKAP